MHAGQNFIFCIQAFFQKKSDNFVQQKALHLFSRGLGGGQGRAIDGRNIFSCFPFFSPNRSGISASKRDACV